MRYDIALSDFVSQARRSREINMKPSEGFVIDVDTKFSDWYLFIGHWQGDNPERPNLMRWYYGVYQQGATVLGSDYYNAYHSGSLPSTFLIKDWVYTHAVNWIRKQKRKYEIHAHQQLTLDF